MKRLLIFMMACVYAVSCTTPIDDEIKTPPQEEQEIPDQPEGPNSENPTTDNTDGTDIGFEIGTHFVTVCDNVVAPSDVTAYFDANLPNMSEDSDTGFSLAEETGCVIIRSIEDLMAIAPESDELPDIDFTCHTLIIGRMVSDFHNLVMRSQYVGIDEGRMVLTVTYTKDVSISSESKTYYNFWGLYEKLPEGDVELKIIFSV